MDLTIKIKMDNAAFDNPAEIKRILNELGKELEESGRCGSILDLNGNKVGLCKVSGKRPTGYHKEYY